QTAPAAAGYFNMYFARRPVRQVMDRLLAAGRAAARRVGERYQAFGRPFPELPVLRLSDLAAAGSAPGGAAAGTFSKGRPPGGVDPDPRERARERLMAALESAGGPRP